MSNLKNKFIIEHYGSKKQILQAVEEMSELTKELIKYLNRNAKNVPAIGDEIADVCLMIEQLVDIFKIDKDDINANMEFKRKRTLQRIKDEEK